MAKKQKSRLAEIRKAIADYMRSEGCNCCRDCEAHEEARGRLGKLLNIRKYEDGSGYDFYSYSTNNQTP